VPLSAVGLSGFSSRAGLVRDENDRARYVQCDFWTGNCCRTGLHGYCDQQTRTGCWKWDRHRFCGGI